MVVAQISPRAEQRSAISAIFATIAQRMPLRFFAQERKEIADRRDNLKLPPFARRVPQVAQTSYHNGRRQDWLTSGNFKFAESLPGYEDVLDNVQRVDVGAGSAEIAGRKFSVRQVSSPGYAENALSTENPLPFAPVPVAYVQDVAGNAYLVLKPALVPSADRSLPFAKRREFALSVISSMTGLHAKGMSMANLNISSILSGRDGGVIADEVQVSRADENHSLGSEFITTAAILYGQGMLGESDIPQIVARYYAAGPVNRTELEGAVALPSTASGRSREKVAFATAFVESSEKQRALPVPKRAADSIRSLARKLFF